MAATASTIVAKMLLAWRSYNSELSRLRNNVCSCESEMGPGSIAADKRKADWRCFLYFLVSSIYRHNNL